MATQLAPIPCCGCQCDSGVTVVLSGGAGSSSFLSGAYDPDAAGLIPPTPSEWWQFLELDPITSKIVKQWFWSPTDQAWTSQAIGSALMGGEPNPQMTGVLPSDPSKWTVYNQTNPAGDVILVWVWNPNTGAWTPSASPGAMGGDADPVVTGVVPVDTTKWVVYNQTIAGTSDIQRVWIWNPGYQTWV